MSSRHIPSPMHAARFVSLFGYQKQSSVGSNHNDVWHSVHTLLVVGKGDAIEHAILLCNLFLGFSMNALVWYHLI